MNAAVETLPAPVPVIEGIGELADCYDGFILDVWGVLHDGLAPYPCVIEALGHMKAAGKRIVVLSNAPARAAVVSERVRRIGIPPEAYDAINTSGEEVWQSLKHRPDAFYQSLGQRCVHIGPERDKHMLEGLDLTEVASPAEASFVLNTGISNPDETIETYAGLLAAAAAERLPMVCANADLVVMQGSRLVLCAGTLAQHYEGLGGAVRWHGKPFRSVYETCFKLLGIADKRRILAVGDSLRTDVAGAVGAGIDCVLVAGGIHAEEFGYMPGRAVEPEKVTPFIGEGPRPVAVMGRLVW
jgi:HAD superfamily hydrolase (TIGR01459 family)